MFGSQKVSRKKNVKENGFLMFGFAINFFKKNKYN